MLRRAKRDSIRPYTLRVVRDHGEGLWTLEDNGGQLYLAVLSRSNSQHRRRLEGMRQAAGDSHPENTGVYPRGLPNTGDR